MSPSLRNDNLLDFARGYVRKLNLGQVIIGVSVILLSVWCIYNVNLIFQKYLDHETIISLQNDPPNATWFPGITVCAGSIFKPSKLAELYPQFKESMEKYARWKRSNPFDPLDFLKRDNRTAEFRHYESLALEAHSASEVIDSLSIRPEELLISCVYHPVNIRNFQIARKENQHIVIDPKNCADMVNILESIYEGHKCFTFYSKIYQMKPELPTKSTDSKEVIISNEDTGGELLLDVDCAPPKFCRGSKAKRSWSTQFKDLLLDTHEKMIFDLNPSIEVTIKAIDDDIWSAYVNDPILMTVHPPNILQNRRDFLFFQVLRNYYFEIAFSKKTTLLLEPPYKTMCVNYANEEAYIRRNVKTRDQCISYCINDRWKFSKLTCANYYTVLTVGMFVDGHPNMTICKHDQQNYTSYLVARGDCERECPNECEKAIFEITGTQGMTSEYDKCRYWYEEPPEEPANNVSIGVKTYESVRAGVNRLLRPSALLPLHKWDTHSKFIDSQRTGGFKSDQTFTSYESIGGVNSKSTKSQCTAKVSIRMAPKPFTTVKHQQAISYEGFLGLIGGHIGIWLGLSLYKIIKFAVHILYGLLQKALRLLSPNFLSAVQRQRGSSNGRY